MVSAVEPIVPGFYPDPSICRAGGTYYLVNSSFEYLPGLPVHASTDLVTWTPVGNALTRTSQLAEQAAASRPGIYAPTIRHHDGLFWIVCTNVSELVLGLGHFIITADDPSGPWSDPVRVAGTFGIDPDLAWDDDGVCHLTWAAFAPDLHGIVTAPIDPRAGVLLDRPRLLWQGTGLGHPEGPHLYRIDGWWYLLLAEGGTERGHSAIIARARSLDDPFEAAPSNPILTHRGTAHPVQNVGHADLIELRDGTWAAVHLAVRPRGQTPGFHVNGRETFLVGLDWVDGWPVVDESRYPVEPTDHSFTDDFTSSALDPRWLGVGQFPATFVRPAADGGLLLDAEAEGPGKSLLAVRLRDAEWSAEAEVDATGGSGAFVVRIDDRHSYGLVYDGAAVQAMLTIGPVVHVASRVPVVEGTMPTLRISARVPESSSPYGADEPDLIELAVMHHDGWIDELGSYDGRYLSTEVAGGFTGRVLGVEARSGQVTVRSVRYATRRADATRTGV
jgi:xylan 1,4-beta-xylosidase